MTVMKRNLAPPTVCQAIIMTGMSLLLARAALMGSFNDFVVFNVVSIASAAGAPRSSSAGRRSTRA